MRFAWSLVLVLVSYLVKDSQGIQRESPAVGSCDSESNPALPCVSNR